MTTETDWRTFVCLVNGLKLTLQRFQLNADACCSGSRTFPPVASLLGLSNVRIKELSVTIIRSGGVDAQAFEKSVLLARAHPNYTGMLWWVAIRSL